MNLIRTFGDWSARALALTFTRADSVLAQAVIPVRVDGCSDGRCLTLAQFEAEPWRQGRVWMATPTAKQSLACAWNRSISMKRAAFRAWAWHLRKGR